MLVCPFLPSFAVNRDEISYEREAGASDPTV